MANGSILRASAALGLVEAAHDGQGDWQAWCERLLDATHRFLACSLVNLGVLRRHEQRYECVANSSTLAEMREVMRGQVARIEPAEMDPFGRYSAYVGTMQRMLGPEPPPPEVSKFMAMVGNVDLLGLVGIVDEFSISVGGPYPVSRLKVSAVDRRLLKQVALHLEAGLRLRLRKSREVGVLSPDGRVLHAENPLSDVAASRSELSRHVGRVERTRTRRHRSSPTAADAWSALVSGEWGIVERTEADGKRYYAVVETHCAPRLKALTPLETQVTELSARGLTGKAVAYALGLTTPIVSKTLFNATLKLGLSSRTELVGLAGRLLGTPRAALHESALTSAERDVLALVRMGHTNAAIAIARKRSERTVANQVSSLLKKLDAPSRRALASVG